MTYARNITDVEDKINARAKEEAVAIEALTARTTQAFHEDVEALGALPPSHEPRATQYIDGMVAMMETLIEKGHAYEAEGHVLFSVQSMADYGKLSRLNRDEIIDGARVEVAPYKRDPADFVLWKPSGPDLPGWDSPWGPRPAGLAHRMLGHGEIPSRRDLRHPWRRPRFGLSPSRERGGPSRPAPTTSPSCATGCTTATWWWAAARCRSRSATSSP